MPLKLASFAPGKTLLLRILNVSQKRHGCRWFHTVTSL
ncbi:hypothetical protein TREVI0001_1486 [Treponema vincentii ATCC 35580]|uniref:Uncharacterized protein n=1 Tax=Treponema vincentii ATCC 35580 TaxID=596324 RepID=C8PMY5_9SPIR|nr:hypothetical protein TREVI0001_1486 [Treponema vincentii ATCC 35580]